MPELISDNVPASSWADEIEEGDSTTLPPPMEKITGNNKVVTEYHINEEGKKVKVVRHYRIDKKLVSKAIARRKSWAKFGLSKNDRPGPDPATTIVAEEIFMQFVANKEESEKDVETTALDKLKSSNRGVVKCRICKEDHWTTNCPYKDTLGPLRDSLAAGKDNEEEKAEKPSAAPGGPPPRGGPGAGGSNDRYVPPSRREGARMGESMPDRRRTEDTAAIRVSNLSENTQEGDLQELFKPFGGIARIFLAKDKASGQCKGFAFINYHRKDDAAKAIATLNGYGYDHLILNVEWANKPNN